MIGSVLAPMKDFSRNKISCLLKSVPQPLDIFFNNDDIFSSRDFDALVSRDFDEPICCCCCEKSRQREVGLFRLCIDSSSHVQ